MQTACTGLLLTDELMYMQDTPRLHRKQLVTLFHIFFSLLIPFLPGDGWGRDPIDRNHILLIPCYRRRLTGSSISYDLALITQRFWFFLLRNLFSILILVLVLSNNQIVYSTTFQFSSIPVSKKVQFDINHRCATATLSAYQEWLTYKISIKVWSIIPCNCWENG
jgi:hypothetical protein